MSLALLAALVLGLAQDVPPQSETALPDVTVSGARGTVQEAQRFVDEISTAPVHALSLATWMTPICVGAANLRAETAAALIDRVQIRAREVGVEVLRAGCSPNITLLATSDGRFTATELVDAYHDRFIVSTGMTQGDERNLRRFAESEAPVRWWTISALMDEFSHKLLVPIWGTAATPITTPGMEYWGQNRRDALLTSLVILDLSKIDGVSDAVLGDYIAMAVLTPLDPDARAGPYPSILNLWDGGQAPEGLTAWDTAYLKALYEAPVRLTGSPTQVRSLYQRNEIARIMARELGADAAVP